jgi:hypothetical protein
METKDLFEILNNYLATDHPTKKDSLSDIIADMEKLRKTALGNIMPISSSTPITSNVEPPIEYWNKTQWEFLKKCCDLNLKQYSIQNPDGDGGYYEFYEVVFETVLHSGCVIIAKLPGEEMVYELPSEHFKENHHIMPQWVKHLMRKVYDNYLSSKKLGK